MGRILPAIANHTGQISKVQHWRGVAAENALSTAPVLEFDRENPCTRRRREKGVKTRRVINWSDNYLNLERTDEARRQSYRDLFKAAIDSEDLAAI